jgi:amino acid transporter
LRSSPAGMVIMMSNVRLVWAMSRDERFPGHKVLHKVSPRSTPRRSRPAWYSCWRK